MNLLESHIYSKRGILLWNLYAVVGSKLLSTSRRPGCIPNHVICFCPFFFLHFFWLFSFLHFSYFAVPFLFPYCFFLVFSHVSLSPIFFCKYCIYPDVSFIIYSVVYVCVFTSILSLHLFLASSKENICVFFLKKEILCFLILQITLYYICGSLYSHLCN